MSDNTLNTANNATTLTPVEDFNQVPGVEPVDYYEFFLSETSTISLLLNAFTERTVQSSIIFDRNNNRLLDPEERLYTQTAVLNTNGTINTTLGAGNYLIEVKPFSLDSTTSYRFSLELGITPTPASIPFDPGNTLNTAYNIGNLTGNRSYQQFVGVVDPVDYYQFSLADTSQINLQLSGITESGLRTSIISDQNNNGLIDNGERLFTDTATVNTNGTINTTLPAGNYFIEVQGDSANINTNYSLSLSNSTIPRPQAPKDFNQDNQTDILLTNPSEGLNKAWLMDGTNYVGEMNLPGLAGYRPMATADFNKDGNTDLLVNNPSNGWNLVWFLDGMNYLGGVGLPTAQGWEIKGAADFNGDGNVDILLNNTANNWNTVWFLGGENGATYTGYGNLPVADGWNITGVADFNGDGKVDILLNNPTEGWNTVWFLDGTDYIGYENLPSSPGWQSLGTGDFNGNGQPDIIMNNITEGWNSIWLMDGTNYTGFANLPNAPAGWEIAGMA
ncbi:FG-GAP repeat domain-containing protein [Nodularia chucula]|uniref:FG-GAP repeat domain-containing protein n=1 Tax=Nodularia chucula TaxID=3093667 RepID=UPI0039C6AFC1